MMNFKIFCWIFRAFFPKVTFNAETLKCQRYIYGGCGGTANLYSSTEECMSTCYYGNPLGTPDASSASTRGLQPRMGFRSPMGQPSLVENDAVVLENVEDESADICNLPPVKPHLRACLAFMKKWTFDAR